MGVVGARLALDGLFEDFGLGVSSPRDFVFGLDRGTAKFSLLSSFSDSTNISLHRIKPLIIHFEVMQACRWQKFIVHVYVNEIKDIHRRLGKASVCK